MVDNQTMINDAVNELNEQTERNARYRIKSTIQNIMAQQEVIIKATARIIELKVELKGITYEEASAETIS